MPKHYVLATKQAYSAKQLFKEGEIASGHNDGSTARQKADKLNKQLGWGRRDFVAIESDDTLKIGECYPEVLAQYLADDFERRAVNLMKSILDPSWRGGLLMDSDAIAYQLVDLGLSEDDLRQRFHNQAQAELNEAHVNRLAEAERSAKLFATKASLEKAKEGRVYSFPVVRGIQAGQAYYVAQVPYKDLISLFVFDDEVLPAEMRAQRVINEKRAEGIGEYVISNSFDYVLPALTASVSAEMEFAPLALPGAPDRFGMLNIPCNATLLINDGQHRRKGIEHALKKRPSLREETIAVALFYDQGLRRSQQMFADINGKQVKPSTAISALYDQRNPFNAWVLSVLQRMPDIRSRIDMENASVGAKSNKLWSLIAFKKFVSLLTCVSEKTITDIPVARLEQIEAFIVRFFSECASFVPRWKPMIEGDMPATLVRENFVIGHAVWLEALAMFGRRALFHGTSMVPNNEALIDPAAANWTCMSSLANITPAKDAAMWNGRCVVLGKMQKTTDGVKSTAAQLLKLADVPLLPGMDIIERQLLAA